jgi:trehalose 6-phosphate phosphatase
MELRTPQAQQHYDEVVAVAREVVIGLDFDGTLSPIVSDPEHAVIHAEAPSTLAALAASVRAVVIITGRPARQVVALGHLDEVADALPPGARLAVMGQYGHERWDSSSREFTSPEPPPGLQSFREELPRLLSDVDAGDALVEEKGLAVAVHTRRLPHPKRTFSRLEETLDDAAQRHGLTLEPGRLVLEVRAPGMHKGLAVRAALEELDAGGAVFVGDDLGDVEAFEAVRDLREERRLPALLVCSASEEQPALADLSDVVVDGPSGVVELLSRFTADVEAARPRD